MSEQDKAREASRLLLEWADGKTLQQLGKPGQWSDYTAKLSPIISYPSCWRIKPEPRTVWLADSSVSGLAHVAHTPEKAEELRKNYFAVTEWQEVLP